MRHSARRHSRRYRLFPFIVLAAAWALAATGACASPTLRCLWLPQKVRRSSPSPGKATVQYTQLFDDPTAQTVTRALGPDRTLRFRYEQDWPDDHVFPNGVSMKQFHRWLSKMLDEWSHEPLMPLRLTIERGEPAIDNLIRLDDTSSETPANAGFGGYQWSSDGTNVKFQCRAVLNVSSGSLTTREVVVALAKHELGHCLTLSHSADRAAAMGYSTGTIDYGASVGIFSVDDLLGLRSVWARTAPGFGALAGTLVYADGSGVGGADVAALDAKTGELIATGITDINKDGQFRIELPAGRHVRLVAHPMQADAALFGEHFLPQALLTPDGFEPTEFRNGDQTAVFTVPDGSVQQIHPLTVTPPSSPALLDKDAPVLALLPGERGHLALHFDGLVDGPVTVSPSLAGLSVAHVTRIDDRVELDVTTAPDAIGTSALEVRNGHAANFQAGTIWVRPVAGLVRAKQVEPMSLPRGATTDVLVSGFDLDQVTAARVVSDMGTDELTAQLVGAVAGGGVQVKVTVPATAADGPWDFKLQTAEGDVPASAEPQPRLWVTTGQLRADSVVDLGEVAVGQPAELTVQITNHSFANYHLATYQWWTWVGDLSTVQLIDSADLTPGANGAYHLTLTPSKLGPTVASFVWLSGDHIDAVTQVRLWAVPVPSGN